jgi:CDP-diacylglycerol--glycerol-3-phosphate 3-phosphatidyltransferase
MLQTLYTELDLTPEQFWSLLPLVGLFTFFILGLGTFAIRTAIYGMPRSGRITSQGSTPFLGIFTMEYFYWLIGPLTRWLVRRNVSPNVLTTWSVVFGLGSAAALGAGWFGLGGWLLMVSAAFDVFDGMVARASGRASESGDYWDSVADRICDVAIFIGFGIYYSDNLSLFLLVALALMATVLVSYTRAKAEGYGVKSYGGVMQRHERVVYLGVGAAMSPLVALVSEPGDPKPEYWLAVAAIAIVAFFSTYTAIRRGWSAFRALKEREARGEAPSGSGH